MSVNDFLYGEHKEYISLSNAVRSISKHNNCTDEQSGKVIEKLLSKAQIDLYIPNRVNSYDCYNLFDDEIPYLKIKEAVLVQLAILQHTGDFDLDEVERNIFGYALNDSAIIAETLFFRKSHLKHRLSEFRVLLDSDSNIPDMYQHFKQFNTGEANLIINNINPQDAEHDINYWQYVPENVEIMGKIIDQHLDELYSIEYRAPTLEDDDLHNPIFKHSTWREWCKRHGHKWNIPDIQSNIADTTPTTDPELRQRAIDLQTELERVKSENELLRGQLADSQKQIDELRLLSNATEATAPHYTHLMKIAIETQRKHWGNWKEGDTPIKQDAIIYDLQNTYKGFSDVRIKAIEAIACPIERKK